MKKTDIAMILLITGLGILIGYLIASNITILKPPARGIEVQTIREISPDVQKPDEAVFNRNAINPTVEVFVGQGSAK